MKYIIFWASTWIITYIAINYYMYKSIKKDAWTLYNQKWYFRIGVFIGAPLFFAFYLLLLTYTKIARAIR